MKVLHIYKDYFPIVGGIENHIRLLAEHQTSRGHDVTVLVTSRGRRTSIEHIHGVRVIKAARLAHVASTPLSASLAAHVLKQRPDVAHVHSPYPVGEMAQYLVGRARHTVLSYHSDVVRQRTIMRFYQPFFLRLLASVDRIFVASQNYLETSAVLPLFAHKCRVVPYGIDRQRFLACDPERARELRERHGGGPLVLFAGVLRYYKGLEYLLEAMARVSARLIVVGDGPMGPSLRARSQALRLGNKVVFVGAVSDEVLPAYYGAADVFVLPASERSEAFGLVLVEAMSSGVPVICTDLGTGTSYVNEHQVSGLVVPPRDPEALASAISQLLDDRTLRRRLADGALGRSKLFSVERMVADIDAEYRALQESPQTR